MSSLGSIPAVAFWRWVVILSEPRLDADVLHGISLTIICKIMVASCFGYFDFIFVAAAVA